MPGRGEELAAPARQPRQGPLDHPEADEHQRATQPLPVARPMEAGEAEVQRDREVHRDREVRPDREVPRDRHDSPGVAPSSQQAGGTRRSLGGGHFLSDRDHDRFRQRWLQVQSGFVDSPLAAAEEADELIGDVLERVTRGLGVERETLAARWRAGKGEADTEDLRLAIQGYRELFERLLGT